MGTIPRLLTGRLETEDKRSSYKQYFTSPEEEAVIVHALSAVPRVARTALNENVLGIFFVNDFSSNAGTFYVDDASGRRYSFLVFHPRVLILSVSEMMSDREKTIFIKDGFPGYDVRVEVPTIERAFLYVLLHEAVHVADGALHATDRLYRGAPDLSDAGVYANLFDASIWESPTVPKEAYRFNLMREITFYGFRKGPLMSPRKAANLYGTLSQSAFISAYATQSYAEDTAELFSIGYLCGKLTSGCYVEISAPSAAKKRYPMLESRMVKERLGKIAPTFE